MRGGIFAGRSNRLRRRVGVALAFVLVLRVLVPAGFMLSPEALAEGLVRVTLCDGYSTRNVLVDALGNIGETDGAGKHCDFALASLAAAPTQPPLLPAPALSAVLADPFVAEPAFARPFAQGPPLGSRAPPSPRV